MAKTDRESDYDSDSYNWSKGLINEIKKDSGTLLTITEEDRIKQLQKCLIKGADVNYVDRHKNTALHYAVQKYYIKIIQFLVEHGAKSDIPNRKGQTALKLAVASGNEKILNATKGQNICGRHRTPPIPMEEDISVEITRVTRKTKATIENEDNDKRKKPQLGISENMHQKISSEGASCSMDVDEEIEDHRQTLEIDGINRCSDWVLKHYTLHEAISQLKLLMIFVERGLQKDYSFRLAAMTNLLDKLENLTIQFMNDKKSETICRFLQAKYEMDTTKKIGARDLLIENDSPYSLQKLFTSYHKLKNYPELCRSKFEDFLICTNADFDSDIKENGLENISLAKLDEPDAPLHINDAEKQAARYKFQVNGDSKVYEILKQSTDVYKLAKTLVEHAYESSNITLTNDQFKRYHIPLAEEIIDVEKKQFTDNFVKGENLSERGTKFREIFHAQALKRLKESSETNISKDDVWKELTKNPLNISATFGRQFELDTIHTLNPLDKFSQLLVSETELPIDNVDREEIGDFFNKLRFAVNQPNEIELGDVLTKNISGTTRSHPLTADMIGNSFQAEILGWFKEMGEDGRFYSAKESQQFFNALKEKVKSLLASELTSLYLKKLDEYGIRFINDNKVLRYMMSRNSVRLGVPGLNTIERFTGDLLLTETTIDRVKTEIYDQSVNNQTWKLKLIESRNKLGQTIFHIAAYEGNYEVIKFFRDQFDKHDETWKDLINVRDTNGRTALHVAAVQEHWDGLKWLIKHGKADVNIIASDGSAILHYAASTGSVKLVKWLLRERGAKISVKTSSGMTLLHYAIKSGNWEVINWVVGNTAIDVHAADSNGTTALHMAVEAGMYDVLEMLVRECGVPINVRDNTGRTLLHEAAMAPDLDILRFLRDHGVDDIDARDNDNNTAVDLYDRSHDPSDYSAEDYAIRQFLGLDSESLDSWRRESDW